MFNFPVTFLLLFFSISATIPAEGKNCWCNKDEDPADEKQIFLRFPSLSGKLNDALEGMDFPGRAQRIEFIINLLDNLSNLSQEGVQNLLKSLGIPFLSFSIVNGLFLPESAYKEIKDQLIPFPIVEARPEEMLDSGSVIDSENKPELGTEAVNHTLDCPPATNSLTWGLEKLQVKEAWKIADGTGILVGSIDTGFRATHEALKSKYADSGFSWFDPLKGSTTPRDGDTAGGHGTHVTGTIVGGKGIGVAPGAKFMACLAAGFSESLVIGCAQFMLCPWSSDGKKKDCSKAPRIVNNSWGGKAGVLKRSWGSMINAFIQADIVPVFAIGNSGPKCDTTVSPANLMDAIAVGGCDSNSMTYILSSRGPTPDKPPRVKPDLSAPGVDVCSSSSKGDTLFKLLDGTSMAAPHVSGIIALMLSVNPKRRTKVEEVKSILYSKKALQTEGLKTNDGKWTCNENLPKPQPSDPQRHDNYFGRGIVNALKAVKNAQEWFKTHPKENEN